MIINHMVVSGILVFATSIFSGALVLMKASKKSANITWSLFSLSVASWGFSLFVWSVSSAQQEALFWSRVLNLSSIFIPIFFYHFVFCFIERKKGMAIELPFSYAIMFLSFAIAIYFPNSFIPSVGKIMSFEYYPQPGILYYIFSILFVYFTAKGTYLLFRDLTHAVGLRRNQVKYLLFGVLIGFIGGSTTFLPVFGIRIYPFGTYLVPIYVLTVTYAILKHRLLDINIALTRAGIFVFVYTLVLGIPFGLVGWWREWLMSIWGQDWFWTPMIILLVLATSGPFIYNSLRRQADNRLLAKDLLKYATLKSFAAALGRMRDISPERICKLILYRLARIMGIFRGAIYLLDDSGNKCIPQAVYVSKSLDSENPEELPGENNLVKFISAYRKEFLLDELDKLSSQPLAGIDYAEVIAQMRRLKAVLIIPTFLKNRLFGFLVLGEKTAGIPYTKADAEVLAAISQSAALAISNADFALKLKDKEREFADKSRIIEIGSLASATGHQLGNVLNNIINFGCGILDNDAILEALKDHPKAMADFDKLVKMIITDAQDGDRIIEEIRGYSRQEGSRELSLVNLKDILDRTLGILFIQVNKFQNIDININIAPNVPLVLVSPIGMQNVLVNMFNNSYDSIQMLIEYLRNHPEIGLNGYKGKIELNIGCLNGKVDIRVSDNGKGMTEDVVRRLFTPFYTTKASINKRREIKLSGGTGIGLYTILLLLSDYGGTIKLVRAEPLKGAEFLIQLPVPKG